MVIILQLQLLLLLMIIMITISINDTKQVYRYWWQTGAEEKGYIGQQSP